MAVALRNIDKRFGPIAALRDVSLDVGNGEIHALLGANGSGKSTLGNCLSGVYVPDGGTIEVGETRTEGFAAPPAAAAAGVRVVHQDSPLILSLSIAENFALQHGYPTSGRLGAVRWRKLNRSVDEALERFSIPVAASARAGDLTPAERAMASLAMVLYDLDLAAVEVLILDEVTAHIPEGSAKDFLDRVAKLPELGLAVLMVTHRFKEVMAYADSATILAGGAVVHSGPARELSLGQLVEHMTAATVVTEDEGPAVVAEAVSVATLTDVWRREDLGAGEVPALVVEGVSVGTLHEVSFRVGKGEIVGVSGLPESGVDELPAVIAGAADRDRGRIAIAGSELSRRADPAGALAQGVAYVPGDRVREGGAQSLTVKENMTLPAIGRFWRSRRNERGTVKRFIEAFDVRPRRDDVPLGTLSGGNQQKVVIAKCLIARPRLLVLENPTAGVDPGARQQLFQILAEAAQEGLAVVMFSGEPEQLADHCQRVLVMREGGIAAEMSGGDLDSTTINQKVTAISS